MTFKVKPSATSVTQFSIPDWIRDAYPQMVIFIQYYYKWMSQPGNSLDYLQNIVEYRDVENTNDTFTNIITKELLDFLPATSTSNKKLLAIKIKDFYLAKGTLPSYDFILNTLFNEHAQITWNSNKVFRPSFNGSNRTGFISIYSDVFWDSTVDGALLVQELPTAATAIIDSTTYTIVNNKNVNFIILDPETVNGTFVPFSTVKVLKNTIDRSWIYVDVYYGLTSYLTGTLNVNIVNEVPRQYAGLIVRQVGSNFRGVISSLNTRSILNGFTNLSLTINTVTGTLGIGDIYFINSFIETTHYTKGDYLFGTVSPSITDINVNVNGSLYEVGETINHIAGSGSDFKSYVDNIQGGAVEHVEIINPGYGYTKGDIFSSDTGISFGNGFSAVVDKIDGYGASIESTLQLDNFNLRSNGSGYVVGDKITIVGGTTNILNNPIIFTVSSINTSLSLNNINLTAGGYNYQYMSIKLKDNVSNSLLAGFTASAVINYGVVQSISVTAFPTLTSSNVSVLINGAGVILTNTVTSGVITAVVISNGGFNYVNPVVIVTSAINPSSIAQFSLVKDANGTITTVNIINGGSGYSATVTISIIEQYGYSASAVAVVNTGTSGPITGLTTTDAGTYTSLPSCFNTPYFSNSVAGTGLILDLKFKIKSLRLLNAGKQYSRAGIDSSIGVGRNADILPIISNGVISTVTVSTGGTGYTYAKVSIIGAGTGFNGIVSLLAGAVNNIAILDGGIGYTASNTVLITGDGTGATAALTIKNGTIKQIIIKNGGVDYAYDTSFSYVMTPSLFPSAIAGIFTPVIDNGKIKSISITDGGSGYVVSTNDLLQESGFYILSEDGVNKLHFPSVYDEPIISSGVSASLTLDAVLGGGILSTSVDTAGSGYYSITERTPISINVNSATGIGAVIFPSLESGRIVKCNIIKSGSGYSSSDTITVTGGSGTGAILTPVFYNTKLVDIIVSASGQNYKYGTSALVIGNGLNAVLSPIVNTSISRVDITNKGISYSNPTLTVNDITGSGASLRAVMDGYGHLTGVTILSGGTGYSTPSITITDGTGSSGVLTPIVGRYIKRVDVINAGKNYTSAQILIVGDGISAKVSAVLGKGGSLNNPKIVYAGSGYVSNPILNVLDTSNYGAVTAVKILSGGNLYRKPPIVFLPNKYNSQNTLIGSGTEFISWGNNIGNISSVSFSSYGSDWTEEPKMIFPLHCIVESNANFKINETISLERYPYQAQTISFNILSEDGTKLLSDYMLGQLLAESGDRLVSETADVLRIETSGDILQEVYTIIDSSGNQVPYFNPGPTGTVESLDFSRKIMKIANATDSIFLITEDGAEIISEEGLVITDQFSNEIRIGDVLIGSTSQAKATILWLNRANGLAVKGGAGLTKKQMTDNIGVLNKNDSLIHDGKRIQDYAYVVKTGIPLDYYKDVITNTVHPAGYQMYGDVSMSKFTKGYPVGTPYSFGIKGANSSFTTNLKINTGFVNYNSYHNHNLYYYISMKNYFYTTQASVFADYTFDNYDPLSTGFISNHAPLTNLEPYVSPTFYLTGSVITASDIVTGITSTSNINIGYRVIGYDTNNNSIFKENYILNELSGRLLAENGIDLLVTDDPFVTVKSVISSSSLQLSKNAKVTGSETITVQNTPGLYLS